MYAKLMLKSPPANVKWCLHFSSKTNKIKVVQQVKSKWPDVSFPVEKEFLYNNKLCKGRSSGKYLYEKNNLMH